MKSDFIETADLRVRIIVGASPAIEGGRTWMLLGAEGEACGYRQHGVAKVLFDEDDIAFNADTVIV
ncbi:hypothetical protein BDN71DRAFT_1455638 [Pleurotus eryngii]|uniref:Uncharacterized protein n=1 Tax=Pleurotus eryngii TaxID=5323 RepID=A0A9P5ZKF8_PLEER|nr:hypothetical protein BDN71DRAFT_1455638 [Pleurotus eryngii]